MSLKTPGCQPSEGILHQRALIIGAGPGGLAAAMLLARAGIAVTILERQPHVGGRTSSLTADGFCFDLGPTFFLYPRVLREIFAAVGRDLDREVELLRVDPQYQLLFGSGSLRAFAHPDQLAAEVARLAPADAGNLRRFLDDNRAKLERIRPCLENPFLGWRDICTPRMLGLLSTLRPWLSLDGELRRNFQDPRVRLAFSFQSKYLGMSPFTCPSLFSILAFLEYEHGVWHPVGGCGAVSTAMARAAQELGVELRLNEEVQGIEFQGRRAVAVRTAQATYPTDALIINADFAGAMTRLVPDRLRRRWTDTKIAGKRFSCSTYMLYLALEGRCDDVGHHTIYMARDFTRNLDDIERRHVLSADPSFYLQNACVTDPSLAPPGMSTLYMLVPVTHRHPNVDWHQEKARYRAVALRQLERVGVTDVERRIRFERIVTPADWESAQHIYMGATFNLAHNLGQMLHLRPRNRFEDLDGVYLVGGGTHPGSGLPVIFESARITARLLLQDFGQAGRSPGHVILPAERPALLGFMTAQRAWQALTVRQRLHVMRRFRQRLAATALETARAVRSADERPLAETLAAEVLPVADACRFLERQAAAILRPRRVGAWQRPLWLWGVRSEVRREPFGTVLVIGPDNYPLLLPGVQTLQALTAGNAVLLKPAPGGAAAANRLAALLSAAGLPAGLLAVLPEALESVPPGVDRVVLTGAAHTGRRVLAERLLSATMELSGCDAAFVLPDADLALVSRALAFGLRCNGGATCIAPRRVFVNHAQAAELEERLVQRLGQEQAAEQHTPAAARAAGLIQEALTQGARLAAGRVLDGAAGITPCVVAAAQPTMRLLMEETFAPVVALVGVDDSAAALRAAAASPYALGATVFGSPAAAWTLADIVRAGAVVINDAIVPTIDPRLPFGGRGDSGFGMTRGAEGLLEMTVPKVICERRSRLTMHLDPPQADDAALFSNCIQAAHGTGWGRWRAGWAALRGLVRRGR